MQYNVDRYTYVIYNIFRIYEFNLLVISRNEK